MNAPVRFNRILGVAAATFTLTAAPNTSKVTAAAAYAGLPLSFEANLGQADPAARFLWHAEGCSLMLNQTGAVLRILDAVLRMQFTGAQQSAELIGVGELPGKVNYFLGNDPRQWRTNIPTYSKVKI